ncbi:MAG: hypothetical protein OXC29_25245 [Rhodococcus sp.]|nr:hypothetical protein [Rhodococcus sp. (in: high G+C Gram-positive bacteria)]
MQRVLMSCGFIVQVHIVEGHPDHLRLAIMRSMLGDGRDWRDWLGGITWDELQDVKSRAGFGHKTAVEVYPDDENMVNPANVRQLWILPSPPSFMWTV